MSTASSTPSSRTSSDPEPAAGRRRSQLVTLGEAMLRLSVRPGDRLEDAPAFDVHVAGTEANVAFAAARVGLRSAWVSALPANPLGRRVAATLAGGGVDVSLVRWVEGGRLGIYFVELGAAPRPISVVYDRANSAIAWATPDLFDWEAAADADFLHVSGITLGLSASCYQIGVRALQEARRRGAKVSLDVNYRERLWTRQEAADAVRSVSPLLDIVISTAEDAADLFGAGGSAEVALATLRADLDVETTVLTLGGEGAIASQRGEIVRRPGHKVEVVDRIGAGDAFDAGLIWGLLNGSIELGLERGLAMAALKMTVHGDLFRLDAGDVAALMARDGREMSR